LVARASLSNRHDPEVLVHDGCKLGIGVFADACAIVIAMLDRLRRLAFEAVGDLLKRPALGVYSATSATCIVVGVPTIVVGLLSFFTELRNR
jgi:hypothetical protein